MRFGRKIGSLLSPLQWPWVGVGLLGVLALSVWLRHLNFSFEFVFYSYLQIVGSLLSLTYAANALVRFRGTHDRQTLILAFGFVVSGLVETLALFSFYGQLSSGSEVLRVPMAWMVGRTLLALVLLSALVVEQRVPHSRDPGREMTIAFLVVGVVAYLTSAAYLGAAIMPAIRQNAWLARPWELFPAVLFMAAAIGFAQPTRFANSALDRAMVAALWLNVACHIAATQSTRMFDAPFTVAQTLKVISYALVLGVTLLDNALACSNRYNVWRG